MRCKNCGSANEDGRYICQNCGSPLYDENDDVIENGGYLDEYDEDYDREYEKKATRKSIIIIVILAVILIAVIVGIVFAVSAFGGGKTPETSSDNISVSDNYTEPTGSISFDNTTEKTTESTTESTTEQTTESTTKTTTTTTTKPSSTKPAESKYKVYVDVDGNGNVLGEGEYSKGKRVTLVATPDAGAQFVGWYENGIIVASGTKYSFTVDNERRLTALFQTIPEEATDSGLAENE